MSLGISALALFSGIAAFAACGFSLALLGLGLPYIVCAAIAGGCAGLLIYCLGRWAGQRAAPDPARRRLAELESEMSTLRHELRGALSPALMISDRLLKSQDPLIRRAGDTVVRSVARATDLIGTDAPRENVTPPAA